MQTPRAIHVVLSRCPEEAIVTFPGIKPDHLHVLDFNSFPADFNELLVSNTLDGYVLVLHGATMVPGWDYTLVEVMEMGASVVSPYVRLPGALVQGEAVEPIDPVGADAWFSHSDVLHRIGGLDTDVLFGQNRLLNAAVLADGGWTRRVPTAVAQLTMDPKRMEWLGNLYYRNIEDYDRITAKLGPEEPPPLAAA